MIRVKIFNENDRLTIAAILVKNGYTVRQGKEKTPGKKSYWYFLECEENLKESGDDES